MERIISNRLENSSFVSSNRAYMLQSANLAPKTEQKVKHKNSNNWKDLLASFSVIAGGGILLYYGIKTPGKVGLFKNNIKKRLFQMEAEFSGFSTFVKKTVDSHFEPVSKYIRDYEQQKFVSPANFIFNIKMMRDPKLVSKINDLAFLAISKSDSEATRLGASDIGNFGVIVNKAVKEASDLIDARKYKTKLVINDYIHVPKFKDGNHSDLVESSENQLISMVTSISQQMDKVKDEKLRSVIKSQYKRMAEVITKSRRLRTESKETAINVTFEHISSLLKLKDFVPSYHKIPTTENFSKLTPEQLKVSSLPKSIEELANNNYYLDIIKSKDFNNISDTDLYEIFYRSPYNNTLKDLGFLIDRIRIKQVIAKASSENADSAALDVIIAKLEYLSNKLYDVGSEELLKKCQLDYQKMNVGQRHARLYYVTTVSRRLGFDSIKDMDEYYAKHNDIYKTLNIRDYIDIFEKNPELYFI